MMIWSLACVEFELRMIGKDADYSGVPNIRMCHIIVGKNA